MQALTNVEKINKIIGHNRSYISEARANEALKSEYNQQAVSFLLETETTCDIFSVGLRPQPWNKQAKVNAYEVTLKNKKHTYTFDFYSSISDTENKIFKTLDFYSVLACMGSYTPESFNDFCAEFGYEFKNESEYIKAKSAHLACLDQDKNLRKLFTPEQLEKLAEIN